MTAPTAADLGPGAAGTPSPAPSCPGAAASTGRNRRSHVIVTDNRALLAATWTATAVRHRLHHRHQHDRRRDHPGHRRHLQPRRHHRHRRDHHRHRTVATTTTPPSLSTTRRDRRDRHRGVGDNSATWDPTDRRPPCPLAPSPALYTGTLTESVSVTRTAPSTTRARPAPTHHRPGPPHAHATSTPGPPPPGPGPTPGRCLAGPVPRQDRHEPGGRHAPTARHHDAGRGSRNRAGDRARGGRRRDTAADRTGPASSAPGSSMFRSPKRTIRAACATSSTTSRPGPPSTAGSSSRTTRSGRLTSPSTRMPPRSAMNRSPATPGRPAAS